MRILVLHMMYDPYLVHPLPYATATPFEECGNQQYCSDQFPCIIVDNKPGKARLIFFSWASCEQHHR